jgi:3',5'-cyclic AMP phosphodiesterase CpdA
MVHIPAPGSLALTWNIKDAGSREFVRVRRPNGHERRVDCKPGYCDLHQEDVSSGIAYTLGASVFSILDHDIAGPYEIRGIPARGETFCFLAFGDSGNGSITQADLAKVMVAARPDLIIHTGDLVYPAGRLEDYSATFFEPYAELIRRIPFMPSLGNHDCATDNGRPLLDVFVLPENGPPGIEPERNYWFDFGDARFVALDANPIAEKGVITADERRDVVAPWLRRVLTECDARWRFVYFHHPYYTGSEHPESGGEHMKVAFMKVMEDCGVDIVFCGHNHLYERTAPMRGDKIMPEGRGVVYVTTGAGGNSRYTERRPPPEYMRAFNDAVFSFTQVDVSPERLELKQIGEDGKAIDVYQCEKNNSVTRHTDD